LVERAFANRNDKDKNITIDTLNAAQRFGRNIWAVTLHNLTVIQGLWTRAETVHSKSVIPVLKRFLRITKIIRCI
jgi:hypothetical protein